MMNTCAKGEIEANLRQNVTVNFDKKVCICGVARCLDLSDIISCI